MVDELKRKLVVVFNKVDLVSEGTLYAWRKYFEECFPQLHVASFSAYPRDEKFINDSAPCEYLVLLRLTVFIVTQVCDHRTISDTLVSSSLNKDALQNRVRRPRKRYYRAWGVKGLLNACRDVKVEKDGVRVDWEELIRQYDRESEYGEGEDEEMENEEEMDKEGEEEAEEEEALRNRRRRSEDDDRPVGKAVEKLTSDVSDEEATPHKDYITIGLVGMCYI